ncbi:MAG: phosphatidate cytidylyltransferase [Deltaproteobacteria bacterium]|nr:phosphatidate cytidylyltransferase [Deltaproteobacteria bacterium]MCB9488491.1 phosphatidate cytidylyltransferase [Deltaproteobacteria bacterium]
MSEENSATTASEPAPEPSGPTSAPASAPAVKRTFMERLKGLDWTKIAAALLALPAFAWVAIWADPIWIAGVALVVSAFMANYELGRLIYPAKWQFERVLMVVCSVTLFLAAQSGEMELIVLALCVLAVLVWSALLFKEKNLIEVYKNTSTLIFAGIYTGMMSGLVVALKRLEPGLQDTKLLVVLFALTWASDAGAFFVGSWLGKHKLWPAVSGGKTWEGLAGGFVITTATALVIAWISDVWTLRDALILGPAFGVVTPVGDLVESAIKRGAGVKDSGFFLPGHGGALDRVDSILFTAPLLFFYATIIGPLR